MERAGLVEITWIEPAKAARPVVQPTPAGAKSLAANRSIISRQNPAYPDWAKTETVEGSVTIRFVVLPDGRVKENVLVEKTSGVRDFDVNAVNALLTWRFEPLTGGALGEQKGTVTFHYRSNEVHVVR
jgi:TonB family protein